LSTTDLVGLCGKGPEAFGEYFNSLRLHTPGAATATLIFGRSAHPAMTPGGLAVLSLYWP